MSQRLAGRHIVLTGVSRGVGLATARTLLDEGAMILGVARASQHMEAASGELTKRGPGRFWGLSLDLASPESAHLIFERARDIWNQVDVLVNNAGVQLGQASVTHEPIGTLERSLELNLMAPYRLSRALLPLLERGREPRVVHVSSGAGNFASVGDPSIGAYRISKWALNGLAMQQAKEFAGRISVVAFDPGWVKTDLGGPSAPGVPEDSARGLLALLLEPFAVTGKFFKDGQEIDW